MATSSKFPLYLAALLLLSGFAVSIVAEVTPPACKRDVDCLWYCERIHQGLALCDDKTGFCICLPRGDG
ncbi:unnamed protein product, partial [Linum tenue]